MVGEIATDYINPETGGANCLSGCGNHIEGG